MNVTNRGLHQQGLKWWKARTSAVLLLLVGGLSVGVLLGAREHWQPGAPVTAAADVNGTLADGRGAVPAPSEAPSAGTPWMSGTVPYPAGSFPVTSLPAYQIAIADPDGVRLKTIVTR